MHCVWIVYGLRHDVGEYGAGLRLRALGAIRALEIRCGADVGVEPEVQDNASCVSGSFA